MLIVYDPRTDEIVAHASRVYDAGKWREATIDEILPRRDPAKLECLYLKDDPRYLLQGPDQWRVRRGADGLVTGIEPRPAIRLACDAKDTDGDGVPDLPADGAAGTHITATLDGASGVDVTFRTTRGALSQRKVATGADGSAAVGLRAPNETVLVTVTATAPGYQPATLQLEVLPVAAAQ